MDYFDNKIIFTKQDVSNRSNIKAIFFDEFLKENGEKQIQLTTNETCSQVSREIICCETFCKNLLNDIHSIRKFPSQAIFCGAWQYNINSTYICTKFLNEIVISEFFGEHSYQLINDSLNIVNFQAIDLIPSHIAAILTKDSSNSDQLCVVNMVEMKMHCTDISFVHLEKMSYSKKRYIVYLQHKTWAILTSKVENNYLQWTIVVFNNSQLLFQDSHNLFSVDNQLAVFGESPFVTVCAVELNMDKEKCISCIVYKFQMR
jgi:hypothetical protein